MPLFLLSEATKRMLGMLPHRHVGLGEMNTPIRFETLNTENFRAAESIWVRLIEDTKESRKIKMSGPEERKAKRRRHKGSSVVKTSNQTCQSFPGSLGFDMSNPAPKEILSPSLDSEVVILQCCCHCIYNWYKIMLKFLFYSWKILCIVFAIAWMLNLRSFLSSDMCEYC